MTADKTFAVALYRLRVQELQDWVKCLSDVTVALARAAKVAPGHAVLFSPRLGGAFYETTYPVQATVGHCQHIASVMKHCADCGWEMDELPPSRLGKLFGRPSAYRVRVVYK